MEEKAGENNQKMKLTEQLRAGCFISRAKTNDIMRQAADEIERLTATKECSHPNRRDVGDSAEGMGHIIVHWCPDCGALKRTMTNWKCTNYPWEYPGAISPCQNGRDG